MRRTQSHGVPAGTLLQVAWAEPPEPEPAPLLPAALLRRKSGWVAVDKPAGVHCQAARHRLRGTLPELVARLLGDHHLPEPVHRLDRDTSGVVVLAREPAWAARLTELWRTGRAAKAYLAVVQGQPGEAAGRLAGLLAPDPARPGTMQLVSREGQPFATRWTRLAAAGGRSLLLLEPETGRMHQLRVSCLALGWPVLGDPRYAPPETAAAAPRLLLHAWRLVLSPPGHEPLSLLAPLPEDFVQAVRQAGLDAGLDALPR
ncbi:MAG: RNA pseudouridine synthase [Myxococcota bacterium]|jgi:23S rRNA-/tRNA-specific pseudouridylate synthase|nr:RNA pseudouridine synthase [Myxococcota bacterium]